MIRYNRHKVDITFYATRVYINDIYSCLYFKGWFNNPFYSDSIGARSGLRRIIYNYDKT